MFLVIDTFNVPKVASHVWDPKNNCVLVQMSTMALDRHQLAQYIDKWFLEFERSNIFQQEVGPFWMNYDGDDA